MQEIISQDSFSTLLLCSFVNPSENIDKGYKPFKQKEWVDLSTKIAKSELERPSNLIKYSHHQIMEILRISDVEAERILTLLSRSSSMALQVEKFNSMGIRIITRADQEYPKRFKKILKSLSPNILYFAGDLSILNSDAIGIVGSRNANEDSLKFTELLTEKAVKEGLVTVSGGSKGIDSVAHNKTIELNGKTIAILSDGLASFIKKKDNLKKILNRNLLVISPYHPNARFYSYTALERNKYIYALSKLTIATSSDYKKGGTWSGAVENLKNKWVPLYIRKDVQSKGLSELEKLGAGTLTFDELKDSSFIKLINSQINVCYESQYRTLESESIYKLVWPIIEKHLKKPISIKKLSEELDLEEIQLISWLNRAKKEEKVVFLDIEIVISSTFYNPEMDSFKQLGLFEI
ncbi:DNA-processing protein DprA [Lysinibacillus sp. NPDC093210]|uniref:DNA-processing protein DprA n=1 Tax=Lysinibacillus sp. NPDC093210 TaxID=3364133 RepID=UPI00380AAF35